MTDPKILWSSKDWYPKEYEFLPSDLIIPEKFKCSITRTIMVYPATASDGFNYEDKAITDWINKQTSLNRPLTSPLNRMPITKTTCMNTELRNEIQVWVKNNTTPEMIQKLQLHQQQQHNCD